MIAKDESLFMVMDAFNMVCRRRRTEKSFRIRMQVELQKVLVTRKGLNTYFHCTFLTMMLFCLVAISHQIQAICVSMTIAQCQLNHG